jgi:CHAT domain-containing protein/tetratricopeptide (TPR) repeat protein
MMIHQKLMLVCLLLTSAVYASSDQAQQAFAQGQFEQAIQYWEEVLKNTEAKDVPYLEAQLGSASAYQALGAYEEAFDILTKILPEAQRLTDKTWQVKILIALGDYYLAIQNLAIQNKEEVGGKLQEAKTRAEKKEEARRKFQEANTIAEKIADSLLLAEVLNKQGNWSTMDSNFKAAKNFYKKSLQLAEKVGNVSLRARVLLNLAQLAPSQEKEPSEIIKALKQALEATQALPASHLKSFGLLTLSQILSPKIISGEGFEINNMQRGELAKMTWQALQGAKQSAEATQDSRALSYSYGLLGKLYEDEGPQRYKEALQLTRQALFVAQREPLVTPLPVVQQKTECAFQTQQLASPVPELTYRWYWQLGRLAKTQGDINLAIEMYQHAEGYLNLIRQPLLLTGYSSKPMDFREVIAPIYLELANLLFDRAVQMTPPRGAGLQAAKETVERLIGAEIKDYFRLNECDSLKKDQPLVNPPPKVGILYPILLPDGTLLKILLNLEDGLYPFQVDVTGNKVIEEVAKFSKNLSVSPDKLSGKQKDDYRQQAAELYQWLIAPVETTLKSHHIDTLVIVPDGKLRTIPFAAFYDDVEKQFLIQKYAVAVILGLEMTEGTKPRWDTGQALLGGLSEAVQDFEALPQVRYELEQLRDTFKSSQPALINQQFTMDNIKALLGKNRYNLVHLSTHGYFGKSSDEAYLLTYNEKLKLEELKKLVGSRFSKDMPLELTPLELMSFSACETAKDDDRAVLGLAGVTLKAKAGAKSALGSLWKVDSESTAKLITEFYQELIRNKETKARALQRAQQTLLNNPKYQHPYYWAAFLLIGNWL